MAHKVQKAKTTAKPRKTSAKKDKVVEAAKPAAPSCEEIRLLAYSYWVERGYQHGNEMQDWLRAEKELQQ
jgi:hypothetical protein